MLSNNQQNTLNTSGAKADVSARVLNADSVEQTRKSDRDKKFLLLVLLIMLLVITQVIVLLASSGVDTSSEPVAISDSVITQDDIKAVNEELKAVMKSLDETEPEKVVEVKKPVAVEQKKVKVEATPVQIRQKLAVLAPTVAVNNNSLTSIDTVSEIVEKKKSAYVKHDSEGRSLADDSARWTCVHDTTTGLMWEVKSQEDVLRNSSNLYSWYNPEHKTLSGEPDGGRCDGGTDCDTNAYIKAINERNYCGHNDWQLPTREQMQSLVDLRDERKKVKINKQYFPNTKPSWYWTSSDKESNDEFAWYVLFRNGFALSDLKERPKHIRLVRKNTDGSNGG